MKLYIYKIVHSENCKNWKRCECNPAVIPVDRLREPSNTHVYNCVRTYLKKGMLGIMEFDADWGINKAFYTQRHIGNKHPRFATHPAKHLIEQSEYNLIVVLNVPPEK